MNDDELRQRLRAADPAAHLEPEDPTVVDSVLEDVMSTEPTNESRETGTRQRSGLTWLVAAAAVVVIAVGGVLAVRVLGSNDPAPVATPPPVSSVTRLTVPDAGSGRCMAPNAATLRTADVAIAGSVSHVTGTTVTLAPSQWYAGAATDTVELSVPAGGPRLEPGIDLTEGGRYLVAASKGQVYLCGMSGPYSTDLASLYDQAFGG